MKNTKTIYLSPFSGEMKTMFLNKVFSRNEEKNKQEQNFQVTNRRDRFAPGGNCLFFLYFSVENYVRSLDDEFASLSLHCVLRVLCNAKDKGTANWVLNWNPCMIIIIIIL